MAAKKKTVVDQITFDQAEPTTVHLDKLFAWVIWQFPKIRAGGHSGAVHPPEAGHGWYPAVIQPDKSQVLIYGHVKKRFDSPEAAAKHLDQTQS